MFMKVAPETLKGYSERIDACYNRCEPLYQKIIDRLKSTVVEGYMWNKTQWDDIDSMTLEWKKALDKNYITDIEYRFIKLHARHKRSTWYLVDKWAVKGELLSISADGAYETDEDSKRIDEVNELCDELGGKSQA